MICATDKCKQGKHQCPTPSKCGKVSVWRFEYALIGACIFWVFCFFAGFLTG